MTDKPKTSTDLTHLLGPAESAEGLMKERDDDTIALRLGRAFLQGRLDKFNNVVKDDFPFTTVDECNIYAGGYQYDDPHDAMSELADMLDQAKGSAAEPMMQEAADIMDRLAALEKQEAEGGLTLAILSERTDLRFKMQMMTLANMQNSMMVQQSVGNLQEQLSQLRRPLAKDKPDAS